MLWFLVIVYRRAAKKISKWMHDVNGATALAATLGITGILVHSLFDFNLQIPANAALFYVLCAIAAMKLRFGLAAPRLSFGPKFKAAPKRAKFFSGIFSPLPSLAGYLAIGTGV